MRDRDRLGGWMIGEGRVARKGGWEEYGEGKEERKEGRKGQFPRYTSGDGNPAVIEKKSRALLVIDTGSTKT